MIELFFVLNPSLSLLVYSFTKLIRYFLLVSYTLSTMLSTADSKNSGYVAHVVFEAYSIFGLFRQQYALYSFVCYVIVLSKIFE